MAPAAGYTVTGGLPDRILAELAQHPKGLRVGELSRAVIPDPTATTYETRTKATVAVGAECSRLYRTGRVSRTQKSAAGRKVPITRYSLPEPEPATSTT